MVRVLIVDDSRYVRDMLGHILGEHSEIEVVGAAADPFEARELIKKLNPDVVTLDIEMPRMDGLTFLEIIMKLRPTPVVMMSSLTKKGASQTIRALEIGALDFIAKPESLSAEGMKALQGEICEKVIQASKVKMRAPSRRFYANAVSGAVGSKRVITATGTVIAIGASTGGVTAIGDVLAEFPDNAPPVMVTQHMPAGFTEKFAARLNSQIQPTVAEAKQGDVLKMGHVYIAPGGYQMALARSSGDYLCHLYPGDLVSGHRPSVDVLFASVAETVGRKAIGIILTGMGKDGAEGLLSMKKAGAYTIGQNEATSVVYGMPQEAFDIGALVQQLPLSAIASTILTKCVYGDAKRQLA